MGRPTRSSSKKSQEPAQILTSKRVRKPVKDEKNIDNSDEDDGIPTKKVKKTQSINKKVTITQSVDKKVTKTQSVDKKEPAKKSTSNQVKKEKDTKQIKKITVAGSVPVDQHFFKANTSRVAEHNGIIYSATLNQTNIANNNNKFYILQIIETGPKQYHFFCRWGRVGVVGQTSDMMTNDINAAIAQYEAKLRAKTKGGDYRLVQMNYEGGDQEQDTQKKQKIEQKEKEPQIKSELPDEVQNLIRLIFDMKMMNNHMKEIGYDAKKMPLGKLSKSSIQKGYQALKSLMEQVKNKNRKDKLEYYSNQFYSYIPHDFGFIKMQNFVLNNQRKIKQKLQMLQSLEDIQIYTKILSEGKISNDMNQMDSNYLKLNTQITPIDKNTDLYKKLVKYVQNTHGQTHNFTLQVQNIFRLDKQEQNKRYKQEINNKQLLWHGSRLTNYVGILSQGLRIAPPQAPVTGYMFGKGVYFADMVTKSANYCCASKANTTGLMLLCEVALGETNDKMAADYYASNLPPGKDSTKGVGRVAPSGGQYIQGAWAPLQKTSPTGINYCALQYNQFIVYDVAQIKSKFLFKMRFHYK